MKILVTGHAGFIGSYTWDFLADSGHEVYGLDDLSRNISVPRSAPSSIVGDVASIRSIPLLDQDFDWVIHLAGQVSVVAGERDPVRDFHSNAVGTFEVVQWAKERNAGIIYSSSNKVFGELEGVQTPIQDFQPYKPETNYGVSKAAGAHYVSDYQFGVVLHQSCIYGPSQLGEIDQGWIGWLRTSIMNSWPITCFGDGTQVRDILHIQDLVALYDRVLEGLVPRGEYVVGGGAHNAVSFKEAVESLGGQISAYDNWRPHDQRYFVSANAGLNDCGWTPEVTKEEGLSALRVH